jgi:hypothetical protein
MAAKFAREPRADGSMAECAQNWRALALAPSAIILLETQLLKMNRKGVKDFVATIGGVLVVECLSRSW